MRAKGVVVMLIALLLVVGLAAAWIFLASKRTQAPQAVFQMPDGTLMQVEGLTFGSNHTFVKGSALLATLRKHAPGKLKALLPAQYSTSTTMGEETLLLWYNQFDPGTGTYTNAALDSFRVIDEHNCVFQVTSYSSGGSSAGYTVANAHLRVFPRRQKTFKVRAQNFPITNIEWTVENPFVTNPPAWKPEPLPATRATEDGTQFTLERVKGHFYTGGSWFEPRFTVMHEGENRTEWYKPSVQYIDATGNRDSSQLCPWEPAWKLDVRFYKSHKAPFPEDQILRVTNLTIPPSGQFLSLAGTNVLAGVTMRLIGLCGSGQFSFSNSVCVASNAWASNWAGESSSYSIEANEQINITCRLKEPTLLLHIDGIDRPDDLLVRFRDAQGSTFGANFRGSGSKAYDYTIKPGEGFDASQRVDLELIPQKPVPREYIVEPPRPNAGANRQ